MRGAVFHPDAFAFQLIERGIGAFLRNHDRRVGVVRVGKRNLLAALRRDVHPGDHRVVFFEFQRRDQAVEGMVGKGAVGLHLFAQRFRQVNVEAHDLVAGIQRFKRRIGGGHAKIDFISCGCASGEGGEQCGQN